VAAESKKVMSVINQQKTIVVLSGGLDSTTLLFHLRDAGHSLKALSVDYGQRHTRELEAAKGICELTNVEHRVVELSGLATIFGHNALTDSSVAVPHGEYDSSTMAVTTVPNRNMILLSIATGWAIASQFTAVAFGAHSGEYTPYPDCQPQFAAAMNCATHLCDENTIEVLAPFVHWNKAAIVKRGDELGVPFELTWSCYEGGERPCGKCSTCLDRRGAFSKAGLHDPATRMYSLTEMTVEP
jgi:7-cyano-7-deazaguanine synthase